MALAAAKQLVTSMTRLLAIHMLKQFIYIHIFIYIRMCALTVCQALGAYARKLIVLFQL